MKKIAILAFAGVVTLSGFLPALSAAQSTAAQGSLSGADKEKLIGAWRLVALRAPGPDGKITEAAGLIGKLIYTRDGHMSVQLMYPASEAALSNDYVLNGYEASFGSYDVNEAAHTVTHHVEGSITHGLVGKSLTRVYRFSDRRLIIQSANPDEHWSVIWEHD